MFQSGPKSIIVDAGADEFRSLVPDDEANAVDTAQSPRRHRGVDGRVKLERYQLLESSLTSSILLLALVGVLYVFLCWNTVPKGILVIWIVVFASILFVRRIVETVAAPANIATADTHIRRFFIGAISTAAALGMMSAYTSSYGSFPLQAHSVVICTGIATGAITYLSTVFVGYAIYCIVLCIPVFVVLLLSTNPDAKIMAKVGMIYIPILLSMAYTYSRKLNTIFTSIRDPLTMLLNRQAFEEEMESIVAPSASVVATQGVRHTLAYFDLDRFRLVNDSAGHVVGDRILKDVAQLLQADAGSNRLVSRLGGDEFAVLFVGQDADAVMPEIERLLSAIASTRYKLGRQQLKLTASTGVVEIHSGSSSVREIMFAADLAARDVNRKGGGHVKRVTLDHRLVEARKVELEKLSKIDQALDDGRVLLAYQFIEPLLGSETDSHRPKRCMEILLRLQEVNGDVINAGDFIRTLEKFGMCAKVDRLIVAQTIRWIRREKERTRSVDWVSINITASTLQDPAFFEFVTDQLGTDIHLARKICFELTESEMIDNWDSVIKVVTECRKFGLCFALDDFGSGFSSLGHLQKLPMDIVKMDKSFVAGCDSEEKDCLILGAMCDLVHGLGKKLIVEGVEDPHVLPMLQRLGVDYVQGFGIHQPGLLTDLPFNELTSEYPRAKSA